MIHILDNLWQQRITLQGYYREPLADEAAALLTGYGPSPGDFDFTLFMSEHA